MKQISFDGLLGAAEYFEKKAEEISTDYSLIDSIRKTIGPKITQDAGTFLNTKAVSSIPVRLEYNKPKAEFTIDATGQDAGVVNQELKILLDKKYGPAVARMLAKAKEPTFGFNLLTVE